MPSKKPISRNAPAQDPRLLDRWSRVLVGGFFLWTFLSLIFPQYDTDFWWHLKTGELIWKEGRLPYVDWYTFTDMERPWIDLHWGFQLLIALLYHLGGVNLVILVKAAIITAAVGVAWLAGGRDLPVWEKAALWILPVLCVWGRGYERPEMLSQLFLALWLWMARHVEERPRMIWLLPLLQLMWVNCHALFVLGLVIGACYLIDCLVRDVALGRWGLANPVSQPSARAIIWSGALVVVACLANPYFEEGARFPLTLFRKFTVDQEFYSKNIGEFHRPIDFLLTYGWRKALAHISLWSELGTWCVAAGSFVWLFWRKRRWSVLRVMLFTGFSYLAWKATRNTNIFALVSGFIACENLSDASVARELPAGLLYPLKETFSRTSLQLAVPDVPAHGRGPLYRIWSMFAVVIGLIIAVFTGTLNELGDKNKPFGLGEAPRWFVHEAAKFAGQPGFPHRAFVSNNGQAAVYIYHNAPERRVFMDGRLEVCTRETFEMYNRILTAMANVRPEWQGFFKLNDGELPVVILDSHTSRFQVNGMLQTPGWRLVFADSAGAVFLSDQQADKLSLPKVDPEPLMYPDGPPGGK